MTIFQTKKTYTNTIRRSSQAGFTLIETLIAIFILALTIGALLTLTAGGFFTIRYAKNDIVATNLLQESLEYIRNTRDTAAQRSTTWSDWYTQYQSNGCNTDNGCMINPYATSQNVVSCQSTCDNLYYYPTAGLYAFNGDNIFAQGDQYQTSFVRKITMSEVNPDGTDSQLIVTARMEWMNGTSKKNVEQSIILTKWNLQ